MASENSPPLQLHCHSGQEKKISRFGLQIHRKELQNYKVQPYRKHQPTNNYSAGDGGSKRVVCFLQQHNTHCGINTLQQAGSVLCNKLSSGHGPNGKGNVLFCWWNSAFQPDCGLSLKRIKTAALKLDYLQQKLRSAATSPVCPPPFFPLRTCRHW